MTPQLVGPANMDLFYDERDDAAHEARGSQILYWLDDLGAKPLAEARPSDHGFVFAGARPIEDYRRLVGPGFHTCATGRRSTSLLRLDSVLDALAGGGRGRAHAQDVAAAAGSAACRRT